METAPLISYCLYRAYQQLNSAGEIIPNVTGLMIYRNLKNNWSVLRHNLRKGRVAERQKPPYKSIPLMDLITLKKYTLNNNKPLKKYTLNNELDCCKC